MSFKKILLCLLVLASAGGSAFAQTGKTITVKGLVIDDDGNPVPGVAVLVRSERSKSTVGKNDGTFTMTVQEGTPLTFSCLGFFEQELPAKKNMTVNLKSDAQMMDEAVVVGYTKESLRNISASVAKVDMQALKNNQSVSLATMLAGQAAGIQTITRSGVPGASNTGLVIRGNNSLSSANDITGISNPLYIIDGIPMSLQDFAGYNVTDNDFLSSLNPEDIQSIDILKDAAATAIYGSRGANGVVIITTRKGTAGDARITGRVSHGFTMKPNKLPVYIGEEERQEKIRLLDESWDVLFGEADWFDIRQAALLELKGYALPAVLTDKYNPAFNNAYDFQNMFYQTGQTQNYDLSMEGGTESNSYRVSLAYYDEDGVLVGYGLSRTNLSASLVTDINKMFHNEVVIRYSFLDRRGGLNDNMKAMPTSPVDLPSSLFYRTDEELKIMSGQLGDAYNKNRSHNLSVGDVLKIKFTDHLTMDNQVSTTLDFGKRDYFIPSTASEDNKSKAHSSASMSTTFNLNSVLNYTRSFGKDQQHTVVGLLGAELNETNLNSLIATGDDGMSDYMKVIQGYKDVNTTAYSNIVQSNMLSFFALASYGFRQNRYKIEGVIRRDASSRFGQNNRWATFPSVKAHWAFSEEPWLKRHTATWLDFGKVRVSYGTSGEIYYDPLLQYNSLVALSSMGGGLSSGVGSNEMDVKTYGDNLSLISDFNKIANKDLSWSKSQEINYGLDLELFKRRLNVTLDVYSRYMSDLVYTSKLPAYVGFNQISSNLVDMVGHGWEASITAYMFPRTSKVQWDMTLNLGRNSTKIAKLGNGGKDYINYGGYYAFIQGAPAFQYYMYNYLGPLDYYSDLPVDPYTGEPLKYTLADGGLARNLQGRIFPGMPVFEDVNGDYVISGTSTTEDAKVIAGKTPEPKLTGGFSTGFKYKNLSVRVNTSFAFGHYIVNTTLQSQLRRFNDDGMFLQYAIYKFDRSDFWTSPGCGAYYPMMSVCYSDGGSSRQFRMSSMFIEPGDYWNIDNVNISYNLPYKWIDFLKIRGVNVYVNASNLYMWKRSSVLDPRMVSRTGFYNGSGYPLSSTFVLGLQLQF